jgi:lipopolysaccharide transport system ATP-binding protein
MVRAEGVGKRYRLRHRQSPASYETMRDAMMRAAGAPFRWLQGVNGSATATQDFWALRDVSFDIASGEVVGIIGRNGAGKSTLLKILSRITEPTTGRVTLEGRLASLLEVGTGFHPELSGRENIYLNGAILGMTRDEIRRNFDSIVAFAEVERFLETPVKRYSSGMYVRLAFAVAAHLEPDILVVDEVLAVGDAEFQKKSLGKMHEVSRRGRTVLFVSHNMAAVQALCSRAIWLDRGEVAATGATADVVARYLHGTQSVERDLSRPVVLGAHLEVRTFRLTPNPVTSGNTVRFALTMAATAPLRLSEAAILIYSASETRVAVIDLRGRALPARLEAGQQWHAHGAIANVNLVEGDYRFGLFVNSSEFAGDVTDLVELTVQAAPHTGDHAPYAAAHRGFVELDVRVEGQES